MEDLQERIDELNGVVSVSKKEISEKREQLKKLENLEKMVEVCLLYTSNCFIITRTRRGNYKIL